LEDELLGRTMQSHILNWIRGIMADPQAQKDLAFTVTLALVCLTIGYFIGEVSSTGLFEPSTVNATEAPHTKKSWPNSYDVTVHADSSDEESGAEGDEDDEDTQGDGKELKGFEDAEDEVKLVLVVRTDLNMGKGTLCAVGRSNPCLVEL
jgi:peptidyl-tRNA hydrolase, PTH2 family